MHISIVLFLAFFIISCSSKNESDIKTKINVSNNKEINNLVSVEFSEIEGFFNDDLDYALKIFKKDCQQSKRFKTFKNVCEKAINYTDGKIFFTTNFRAYKLIDQNLNDIGLITGYYEPLLYGSFKKDNRFKYPIYQVPKNLVVSDDSSLKSFKNIGKIVNNKLVPYDTRKQIESNSKNKYLEPILYVDNKIDLFFLHIQGSGKVKLQNGNIINITYAQQNGRAYTGIGKYLAEKNYVPIEEMSLQAIKNFLESNPSKIDYILNMNESYIFFSISKTGAVGALNSILTPRRNLAVDTRFIPLGAPVFLKTNNPITKEPINQLMVAADVGGAIKGYIRADFFWGFGASALEYAGKMKEEGKMYVLLPL